MSAAEAIHEIEISQAGMLSTLGFDDWVTGWVAAQMATPPTLHRVYYRQRANPRLGGLGKVVFIL